MGQQTSVDQEEVEQLSPSTTFEVLGCEHMQRWMMFVVAKRQGQEELAQLCAAQLRANVHMACAKVNQYARGMGNAFRHRFLHSANTELQLVSEPQAALTELIDCHKNVVTVLNLLCLGSTTRDWAALWKAQRDAMVLFLGDCFSLSLENACFERARELGRAFDEVFVK